MTKKRRPDKNSKILMGVLSLLVISGLLLNIMAVETDIFVKNDSISDVEPIQNKYTPIQKPAVTQNPGQTESAVTYYRLTDLDYVDSITVHTGSQFNDGLDGRLDTDNGLYWYLRGTGSPPPDNPNATLTTTVNMTEARPNTVNGDTIIIEVEVGGVWARNWSLFNFANNSWIIFGEQVTGWQNFTLTHSDTGNLCNLSEYIDTADPLNPGEIRFRITQDFSNTNWQNYDVIRVYTDLRCIENSPPDVWLNLTNHVNGSTVYLGDTVNFFLNATDLTDGFSSVDFVTLYVYTVPFTGSPISEDHLFSYDGGINYSLSLPVNIPGIVTYWTIATDDLGMESANSSIFVIIVRPVSSWSFSISYADSVIASYETEIGGWEIDFQFTFREFPILNATLTIDGSVVTLVNDSMDRYRFSSEYRIGNHIFNFYIEDNSSNVVDIYGDFDVVMEKADWEIEIAAKDGHSTDGAVVSLYDGDEFIVSAIASDGFVEFSNLPYGKYTVSVNHSELEPYTTTRKHVPVIVSFSRALYIPSKIELRNWGFIIAIVNEKGDALSGFTLNVYSFDDEVAEMDESDFQGNLRFRYLRSGRIYYLSWDNETVFPVSLKDLDGDADISLTTVFLFEKNAEHDELTLVLHIPTYTNVSTFLHGIQILFIFFAILLGIALIVSFYFKRHPAQSVIKVTSVIVLLMVTWFALGLGIENQALYAYVSFIVVLTATMFASWASPNRTKLSFLIVNIVFFLFFLAVILNPAWFTEISRSGDFDMLLLVAGLVAVVILNAPYLHKLKTKLKIK